MLALKKKNLKKYKLPRLKLFLFLVFFPKCFLPSGNAQTAISGIINSYSEVTSVVDADDIIEEIETLAFSEVDKRYPNISDSEKSRRAKIIGLAALKFFILKYSAVKGFVFKPDESISFEGETGPYIQYCYARIESILSKSGLQVSSDINWDLLNHESESYLMKQLTYFPEIVDQAEKTYSIHLIAQFLLTLCQTFNTFYSSCQVISDDKELEKARLLLIKCVQIEIKIGLNILGIETLDKM